MEALADVIVDRVVPALDHPFTYRVPPSMRNDIAVGQLVTVPFRSSVVSGVVYRLYSGPATPEMKEIVAVRTPQPVLTPALLDLAQWMSERYLCFLPQVLRAMIPAAVRRGGEFRSIPQWYRVSARRQGRQSLKQAVYDFIAAQELVDRRTVLDAFPKAAPALRSLVAEHAVEVISRPMSAPLTVEPGHVLSRPQSEVVRSIEAKPGHGWLLEGVTGSGKTEVYLALIDRMVHSDQEALVLLPEIALTPQVVMRFRARYGDQVGVWHSGLSQAERWTTWDNVRRHVTSVVVGARSAIFLPFSRLGMIVIDEEHEPSYKQEDHPRYHTREVALWRGQREGATVVLGSATPSLESRYAAERGELGHVWLPERAMGRALPSVELVDMREELKNGNREIFSRTLRDALCAALADKEQAILFLNRRGYSTFVLCRQCGHALQCPECAVSLTYHRMNHRLTCHYCLREFPVVTRCPECGSEKIRYFGAGTERVVEEVQRLCPDARVLRADRDTMTRARDYASLYLKFYQGDADVLVGTQMIAKGMDFPHVSLVGVVAADTALHLPDYRSAERTFQLLVQAGGRSGRGAKPGRVVIQTYNPDHYAVRLSRTHDYARFYEEELTFRQATQYPPFADLWLLVFEADAGSAAAALAQQAADELRRKWPNLILLGPAPAPLQKVQGRFRYHVLIKIVNPADDGVSLSRGLKDLQSRVPGLSITRDPYFLM
ncbi:MAG: primosomal protein N' [Sulfobacillus acidophilus]|uniref:Replication restart protein PriA n=1 Tax=Sulfobacillus acidophilus TaxID=53633 RepID=A0A2T2WEY5_9FIRM|nr:MAG: primosomal protein N' [Sulfobacillus acidophilus]